MPIDNWALRIIVHFPSRLESSKSFNGHRLVDEGKVEARVLAVAHSQRRPNYWKRRRWRHRV